MSDAKRSMLVFSDDWGVHPSSCQHLVRELLPEFDVHWVNTIGTRRLTLDRYTLARSLMKLRSWSTRNGATVTPGQRPEIINPVMLPGFGSLFSRSINRRLMSWAIAKSAPSHGWEVAVTTLPIVADLVGGLPVDRWVYYCVDDLSQWPGLDRRTLESMETELVEAVDEIVAVSTNLVERMSRLGRSAHLLTHGVDLEHWSSGINAPSPLLAELPEPRAVFWGVVDRRLDASWLQALSRSSELGSIILVGPQNDPDERLWKLPKVYDIGSVPYESLPSIAAGASVLIMPYADLPVTRAMQPLKLKEYLATGKPVVTSALPAVREWQGACDMATSAQEFVELVMRRARQGLPPSQGLARQQLVEESWQEKARVLRQYLAGDTDPLQIRDGATKA